MAFDATIGTTTNWRGRKRAARAAIAAGVLLLVAPLGALADPGSAAGPERTPTVAASPVAVLSEEPLAFLQPDLTLNTSGIPTHPLLDLSSTARAAERHILIGLMLIAIALMAGTTFSLWRWQLRGLAMEARYHDA